jgi:L-asparaginase/Glu-tRNA(Gln) amidotransferase subunit D
MDALREACNRGVIIVAISQCAKGTVSSAYATGQTLLQAGVIAGGDMTPEVRFIRPFLISYDREVKTVRTCQA